MEGLNQKITNATKWSALAEIAAKLVLPIVNMILARILTPESFGIVATVTVAISFAEIFQDAGFQKYIIQHEFETEEDYNQSANVAFWTNLTISVFLWVIIMVFRNGIASLIGGEGLGFEIAVASISLPIFAVSSIQTSYYKRKFDYKKLFWVRIITSVIPLVVTVPIAIILKNHWALIIGTIARNIVQAVILYTGSSWKPKLCYSFTLLKEMLSFCIWTLQESISIWLTANASIFIVTRILGTEIVGYYKTSMTTVTSVTGIISAATLSVLFSALSRLQNDEEQFRKVFYNYQKIVSMFVIPLGVGIWLYRDLFVRILLGEQWLICSDFVGMYAFAMAVAIVTNSFFSELYRAKGKPKISMLAQIIYLSFLIPSITISAQYGFKALYITTTVAMLCFSIVHFVLSKVFFGMNPITMLRNFAPIFLATGIMATVSLLLQTVSGNIVWTLFTVFVCIVVYVVLLIIIKPLRESLRTSELTSNLYSKFTKKFIERTK